MKKVIIFVITLSMIIGTASRYYSRVEISEYKSIMMENPTEPECVVGVVGAYKLNVRKEPDISSNIMIQLEINSTIEIFEQRVLNGVHWGRTNYGWVNLAYVNVDKDDYTMCENCGIYLNK